MVIERAEMKSNSKRFSLTTIVVWSSMTTVVVRGGLTDGASIANWKGGVGDPAVHPGSPPADGPAGGRPRCSHQGAWPDDSPECHDPPGEKRVSLAPEGAGGLPLRAARGQG